MKCPRFVCLLLALSLACEGDDDGSLDGSTGGGEKPTHLYDRPGEYRVILTITGDSRGSCNPLDTDETRVTVVEAPRVSIDGPGRVAIGIPVTWRAVASSVAGAGEAVFAWQLPGVPASTGPTVTHSFAEPGIYEVALTARFGGGEGDCGAIDTALRVVANAPPVADTGDAHVVALGDALLVDASASSDPDGAITRYEWDFGDGATATGVQARHLYAEPGTYTLALTVTDDAGVANAVGAVAGQVRLSASAEVAPLDNGRFRVMVGDQVADFDTESQALAHAGERAAAMAVDLALSAGAAEAHAVVTRDIRASDLDGQRFLVAATVTATASGRPRLATG